MTKMLNIRDVRDVLGLSYIGVIKLVRSGQLRAYSYTSGGPVSREEVTDETRGLRFKESDVDEMLEASLIS